ncbi:hypothetical protein NKG94_50185 [Micromonospora sp. M12]
MRLGGPGARRPPAGRRRRQPGRVYVGTGLNVYLLDNVWPNERAVEAAGGLGVIIGSDKDFAATRIAYKLNLQGGADSADRLLDVAGRGAPGDAGAAHLRRRRGTGRCGHRRPPTRRGHLHEPGGIFSADGRCRASTPPPTGRCRATERAWWCSSASPTRCVTATRCTR